ncbi:acyltransferase family protein [Microbacterium sp. 1P10AE]|uniref:acyltransferase family protein n=1 Tax=Microbacterium sp. 1P10AE TaxID=3132286 RepID=UPI0039A0ED12
MTPLLPVARSRAPAAARRHDLDGLRALAVLLVAVSHVWIGRVSGGVDVFLLLSGFFVGGGIVRAVLRGDFAIGAFLVRTGRRLLPALFFVLLVILAATAAFAPVPRWSEAARQTLASAFSVENWYLAGSGRDYGAAAAVDSPYQHLWSMSVQMQLFVAMATVVAIVAVVLRRRSVQPTWRAAFTVTAVACGASFLWASVGVAIDPAWAYFDTVGRAWEFLLGTMLALLLDRARSTGSLMTEWVGPAIATVLAWCGVAAILVTGLVVDGGTAFPGPAALLPLTGAVLLVLFPGGWWGPSRLLAWRPVAAAGLYAYAFYLWHWPVLVFALRLRGGEELGWLGGSAVLGFSAVLAWGSVRFVERRFAPGPSAAPREQSRPHLADRRAGSSRPTARALGILAIAGALVVAVPTAWLTHVEAERAQLGVVASDLDRYPGASVAAFPGQFSWDPSHGRIPSSAVAAGDTSKAIKDGCNAVDAEVVLCSYGDLDATRVLAVVGGSHTEQWADALSALGEEHGFRVDTMIKWSCELVDGREGVEFFDDACVEWSAHALDALLEHHPDAVFTTGTRPNNTDEDRQEMVPWAYERAWARLAEAGIPIVTIRDNPWTGRDPVDCVTASETPDETCGIPRADVLDESPPPTRTDPAALGLLPLDLTDVLCSLEWCAFAQGGRLVYRDDHHLTNSWVMSTVPILRERMLPLLGW